MFGKLVSKCFSPPSAPTAEPPQVPLEQATPPIHSDLAPSKREDSPMPLQTLQRQPSSPKMTLPPKSALPRLPEEVVKQIAMKVDENTRQLMSGVSADWRRAATQVAVEPDRRRTVMGLANWTGPANNNGSVVNSPAEFIVAVRAVRAGLLKTLNLSVDSDEDLGEMMHRLPDNLQGLDLSECTKGLTAAHMKTAVQKSPQLRDVDLTGQYQLPREGLLALQHLPQLRTLKLGSCSVLTGETLSAVLQNTPQLTTLDLKNTNQSSKCVQALQNAPQLHTLSMNGCYGLTNADIPQLQSLPHLHTLDLSNTNLTDEGVRALLQNKTLRKLNLSECPGVSDGLRTELRNQGIEVA
jgi:hypothetical protein